MTDPHVPHRFELEVEVPGTADQVWHAIATADGISAWMMPTELEEREGGAVSFRMGPDASSDGTVTGWEPPHRLVYEEDWATLAEQDPSTVTPLVTEFLVEARSGGTCVVKVVTSAFGSGAEWEREFFEEMGRGWTPMFEHLRLYLAHFAGQRATTLEADAAVRDTPASVVDAARRSLGIERDGDTVDLRGSGSAVVERISQEHVLLRLTDPVPGIVAIYAYGGSVDDTHVRVAGYLFSDDAHEYIGRVQPEWQSWLGTLTATVPS